MGDTFRDSPAEVKQTKDKAWVGALLASVATALLAANVVTPDTWYWVALTVLAGGGATGYGVYKKPNKAK